MIKELSFIAYYVRDVPRARKFYGEVLGLKPGQWFNDEWIIDLGNATFALDGTGEELGVTPGTSIGAAFEVDDIHAMRERLVDAGARVTEIYDSMLGLAEVGEARARTPQIDRPTHAVGDGHAVIRERGTGALIGSLP